MPLWFETALLPQGWADGVRLSVSEGKIERVETGSRPEPDDDRHAAVIPGLCNVHSHGFQRGMAGLAEVRGPEGDNFWTWREVMYRFLDRLHPEQIEAITTLAYVEMLETGFTRVGEFHYLHRDPSGHAYSNIAETAERVVASANETGIALTLLPVFYAHANFGGAPPTHGQRRFITNLDEFTSLLAASHQAIARAPGGNIGVAPHSLRAVTSEELSAVLPLANNGPVHIHAAEQTKEVDDCLAWSGQRPVEWLLANTEVDRRWCLVHATHMTLGEAEDLARSGAVAGLCPVTEANLGDGIFPARAYLKRGGAMGIGTDSNIHIDPAAELRGLEYSQRLSARSRNVLSETEGQSTGRALFEAALQGGARALAQSSSGIAEGGPADLVSLDRNDPAFFGRRGDAILDSWVFASGRIDCVWRGGRKLVEHGRHFARDDVARRYRRALESVLE